MGIRLLLLLLYFTSPELQAVECLLTRPGLVNNVNEHAKANEKQEIETDEKNLCGYLAPSPIPLLYCGNIFGHARSDCIGSFPIGIAKQDYPAFV